MRGKAAVNLAKFLEALRLQSFAISQCNQRSYLLPMLGITETAATKSVNYSRSFSTVRNLFCVKPRNSVQRGANRKWMKHLVSATVRKPVKTHAKTLSLNYNQMLYQLSYAGAAHMKAVLASSSRVRLTIITNNRCTPHKVISSRLTLRAHARTRTCATVFAGCCLLHLSVATVL